MKIQTPKAMIAAGSVALLVIALLGWFLAIAPANAKLAEAQESLTNAADANDASQMRLRALQAAEANLPTTRKAATALTDIWPITADQADFFAAVTGAATDAGIAPSNITDLSPSTPTAADADATADEDLVPGDPLEADFAIQNVTLAVDGSYPQLVELVENLATLDRAVFVEAVTVTGDGSTLTLTLTASTFVAPPLVDPTVEKDAADEQDADADTSEE